MSIPLILDIAIGLIFIYLILSLLASEIQELISTLLQWRAEHLKKSIEVLIAGGNNDNENAQKARTLANSLYDHPLLRNLNQEAKGLMAKTFRKISDTFIKLGRQMLPKDRDIFGNKDSGPSYIPPESFARTLIDTLKIKKLAQLLSLARVEKFKQDRLLQEIGSLVREAGISEDSKALVEKELNKFAQSLETIVADLKAERTTLEMSIERMSDKLDTYISNCKIGLPADDPSSQIFLSRLQLLKQDIFGDNERIVLLGTLKPKLQEVMQVIARTPELYSEFEQAVNDPESPTYIEISKLIDTLPKSLKDSISELANRVKSGSASIEDDLTQLQIQIETWFDRSMDRASGVYKRNAKGVAILIGLLVAGIANTDTFHIVGSLSRNSVLRATIVQNAEQVVTRNPEGTAAGLTKLKTEMREALSDVSIPIGWSKANQRQQFREGWKIPYLKQIAGWIVSGLAISMGSSFWFNLLNKLVNVRNTGKSDFPKHEQQIIPEVTEQSLKTK
ncbi:hypothetical protein [Microcoleus sp. FACHB-68]|uniref:hypothetical protein n=1 Tax=Microcoleus sp. FACHB-68 TaxID=2692826 RepID=UPI001687C544|nr:hypothetical protein [Microcoleus sp. FACHB-68]MBD1939441.1 hypothetical protein [Microcoleus sp. FACHB-68]